jgi:hypothetical protein
LPKESPWQADGGLKSLEGTDRNACASRAWKGGNINLVFLWSTVSYNGAFLFSLIVLSKSRSNLGKSLGATIFEFEEGASNTGPSTPILRLCRKEE